MQDPKAELVEQFERVMQAFIDLMEMVGVSNEEMEKSPIIQDARRALANTTR